MSSKYDEVLEAAKEGMDVTSIESLRKAGEEFLAAYNKACDELEENVKVSFEKFYK